MEFYLDSGVGLDREETFVQNEQFRGMRGNVEARGYTTKPYKMQTKIIYFRIVQVECRVSRIK